MGHSPAAHDPSVAYDPSASLRAGAGTFRASLGRKLEKDFSPPMGYQAAP